MSVVDEPQSPEDEAPASIESPANTMPPWVPRAIALFFVGVIVLWALRELFSDLSGFLVTILISLFFSLCSSRPSTSSNEKAFAAASGHS